MTSTLTVVVADDDVIVRSGIESLLSTFDDVRVAAVCETLPDLLQAVDEWEPDVVLTDIRMPPDHHDEGVQAARQLRDTHPDVGVVVLSQFVDPQLAYDVLQDGSRGRGYLRKEHVADAEYLAEALRSVAAGGSFIDAEVLDALLVARNSGPGSLIDRLTGRELEVLEEIAAGHSNAVIAERLFIGERAVEKHISAVFAKLELTGAHERHKRVAAVLVFLSARSADRDVRD